MIQKSLSEKLANFTAASDLKASGLYPYFRSIE
jgi:hypothetical protein